MPPWFLHLCLFLALQLLHPRERFQRWDTQRNQHVTYLPNGTFLPSQASLRNNVIYSCCSAVSADTSLFTCSPFWILHSHLGQVMLGFTDANFPFCMFVTLFSVFMYHCTLNIYPLIIFYCLFYFLFISFLWNAHYTLKHNFLKSSTEQIHVFIANSLFIHNFCQSWWFTVNWPVRIWVRNYMGRIRTCAIEVHKSYAGQHNRIKFINIHYTSHYWGLDFFCVEFYELEVFYTLWL